MLPRAHSARVSGCAMHPVAPGREKQITWRRQSATALWCARGRLGSLVTPYEGLTGGGLPPSPRARRHRNRRDWTLYWKPRGEAAEIDAGTARSSFWARGGSKGKGKTNVRFLRAIVRHPCLLGGMRILHGRSNICSIHDHLQCAA